MNTFTTYNEFRKYVNRETNEEAGVFIGTYATCTDPNCNCVGGWTIFKNDAADAEISELISDGFVFVETVYLDEIEA